MICAAWWRRQLVSKRYAWRRRGHSMRSGSQIATRRTCLPRLLTPGLFWHNAEGPPACRLQWVALLFLMYFFYEQEENQEGCCQKDAQHQQRRRVSFSWWHILTRITQGHNSGGQTIKEVAGLLLGPQVMSLTLNPLDRSIYCMPIMDRSTLILIKLPVSQADQWWEGCRFESSYCLVSQPDPKLLRWWTNSTVSTQISLGRLCNKVANPNNSQFVTHHSRVETDLFIYFYHRWRTSGEAPSFGRFVTRRRRALDILADERNPKPCVRTKCFYFNSTLCPVAKQIGTVFFVFWVSMLVNFEP